MIARSVTSVSAPSPQWLGAAQFLWGAWSDGFEQAHAITAPASGTATYTATFAAHRRRTRAWRHRDGRPARLAARRPAPARSTGRSPRGPGARTSVRLYLDSTSQASELVLALYGERADGEPDALLAQGTLDGPVAGAWNAVTLDAGVRLEAGTPYWIGFLNPAGSAGTLRWRDRAGDFGTAERVSQSTTLSALPASWAVERELVGRAAVGLRVGNRRRAGAGAEPTPTATPTPSPDARADRVAAAERGASRRPARRAAGARRPAPVGAWGFDERSGTTAKDAAGRNPGRLTGPLRVAGRFGGALDFDGRDDWVTLRAPKLTGAMTVEAWVRPTRRSGAVAAQELEPFARVGPVSGRRVGPRALGTRPIRLNRWTHLALTYDGTTIRRYVDGAPAGTRRRRARSRGTHPLRLGGNAVLEGVVPRPARRAAPLRPRAERGGDPHRHGERHQPGGRPTGQGQARPEGRREGQALPRHLNLKTT